MSDTTFEDLTKIFNGLVKDPSLFDCGEVNLIKVFQHAVGSYLRKEKEVVSVTFHYPNIAQKTILPKARKFRRPDLYNKGKALIDGIEQKPYLVYSGGNCLTDEEGNIVSSNTKNILEALGRENCLYVYKEYRNERNRTGQDFSFSEVNYYAENAPFTAVESKMLRDIQACYKRVAGSGQIPEDYLFYFKHKLQLFFLAFRSWCAILDRCKPEKIYFSMHYFHEGIVAAAKLRGIPIVELQHGLISENDYYYVYSSQFKPVIDRALFGDRIFIFGKYWGEILDKGCEYPEEKQALIGAYQYRPKHSEAQKEAFSKRYDLDGRKVILLTTQTGIPEYYSEYVTKLAPLLAKKHPEYKILIKPHPYQQGMDLLEAVTHFENVALCAKTEDLMLALHFTDIQISLYSTTFYDAIGSDVLNLSIYKHPLYQRYADLMIEEGIAWPLEHDEDPVEVADSVRARNTLRERDHYYAPFNADFDEL